MNTLRTYGNDYIPFYVSVYVLVELSFQFIEIILVPTSSPTPTEEEKIIYFKAEPFLINCIFFISVELQRITDLTLKTNSLSTHDYLKNRPF